MTINANRHKEAHYSINAYFLLITHSRPLLSSFIIERQPVLRWRSAAMDAVRVPRPYYFAPHGILFYVRRPRKLTNIKKAERRYPRTRLIDW
jgi:hypothetical protein